MPPTGLEDEVGVALGPVIVNGCYRRSPGSTPAGRRGRRRRGRRFRRLPSAPSTTPGGSARSARRCRRRARPPRPRAPARRLLVPFLFTTGHRPDRVDTLSTRWPPGRWIAPSRRRRLVGTCHRRPTPAATTAMDAAGGGTVDHRLLRIRRGRQDDDGGGARPRGGEGGAERLCRDHRPGPSAGQLARRRPPGQPADAASRATGRASCTRSCSTRSRPSTTSCTATPSAGAGGGHPAQPHLLQPDELPVRTQEYMATEKLHELVEEGGYDLVVVDTPPTVTPSTSSTPPSPEQVPREPVLQGPHAADPGRPADDRRRRPGPAADALQGGRCRDRARCGGVLPGVRRHGGGLPGPRRLGSRAAATARHRLRLVASPSADSVGRPSTSPAS